VSTSRAPSGRSGRRRGATQTRDAIAAAARSQFAELGYDRTTIRGIAREAGVDPALVVHFYGRKEALFREVMSLPPEVAERLADVGAGARDSAGRRLAEVVVALLEHPESRGVVLGRIRSAVSHPDAAALVRETVMRDVGALASSLTDDRPETRAVFVGSQIIGVALARYVVSVEPLASMEPAELVDLLADSFQRFLVEPLPERLA
jgi:AcrR family transcriptional regulator